jgi:hypothetical protein
VWATQTQGHEDAVLMVLDRDGHGMVVILDENDQKIFSVEDDTG